MKYTFKNLGPIKNAEMELGELTVIAGANNTGKTYVAYALYGLWEYVENLITIDGKMSVGNILRHWLRVGRLLDPHVFVHRPQRETETDSDLKITITTSNGITTVTMNRDNVRQFVISRIEMLCRDYSRNIGKIFATPDDAFKGAKVSILATSHAKPHKYKDELFTIEVSEQNVSITADKDMVSAHISKRGLKQAVKGFILGYFIVGNFPSPFILPAERFGVSLFYKELDFTKNRVVEILQKMKDENVDARSAFLISDSTARYAKPLKDNIDFTRSLVDVQKRTGALAEDKFHDDIKDMMGGYYRWENNEIFFISKGRKDNAFKIPLYLASSSARGLSGLYFYLRNVARKNDILIVDEPETHLDTKNQILMARLLTRCVNAGLRVLITTHSDYIIKEFNNLIMLSAEFPEKEKFLAQHKKQYTENNYLRKDAVCAYVCEKGGLTQCEVDSRGMIMPSFDNTIDDINRVSNLLDGYLPDDA